MGANRNGEPVRRNGIACGRRNWYGGLEGPTGCLAPKRSGGRSHGT